MKTYFYSLLVILSFSLGFISCVDNVIDEPPAAEVPVLETNATISDVVDLWVSGQNRLIDTDLVFDAIVVADDESGNFYKNIIVEDETGGITIRIEANNIYSVMPVGRRIYVKARGLYVGDYNGLIQMGFGDDNGDLLTIPFSLVGDEDESVIVPAERFQDVTPATVRMTDLGSEHLSTLIKLEDVQFVVNELGLPYADADNQQTLNRNLEDCDGNSIIVRTSGFSSFAGDEIPSGNGDLLAVYTVFGTTQQLVIRDPADLTMTGERCGEVVVDVPDPNATIGDVLALYQEGNVTAISSDMIFDGVVTANDISGNFFKQIIIEDENDAINIQIDDFDLFNTFYLGRRVVVKAQDLAIGDFNGLPQIGMNDGDNVSRIPSNIYPTKILAAENEGEKTPQIVSISDLQNGDFYNKLIQLNDVEFVSGALGSTFADDANNSALNHDVANCDEESVILRSSGFADFAGVQLPEGNGTLIAIFSVYQGTKQLVVRKIQDVSFTGDRCDGGNTGGVLESLNENFESVASDQDVSLSGWTNTAVQGLRVWRGKEFGGNTYVQATAFQDDQPSMETWLISPKVKMNGNNSLSFRSAQAFYNHDGLSVYVSSDFNGDPSSATWTALSPTLAGNSQANYDWVESGDLDLSSYNGEEIVIGFKYEGEGSGGTTSYIIDDVVITK